LFSEREWGDVEVILDTSGRFNNTPNQTKPELNPHPAFLATFVKFFKNHLHVLKTSCILSIAVA
ncbi:MAG: hypothetical protein NC429_00440, partial [Lachnospiraceae bacterium]|nr:hypothetical protein [Lachnospiraceae bacterium]